MENDNKEQEQCTIQNIREPLILGNLTINPIDKDGDFEFEMEGHTSDAYKYVTTEEAKIIVDYLTKNINAL